MTFPAGLGHACFSHLCSNHSLFLLWTSGNGPPGMLLEMQNLSLTPDLLNQNQHFNKSLHESYAYSSLGRAAVDLCAFFPWDCHEFCFLCCTVLPCLYTRNTVLQDSSMKISITGDSWVGDFCFLTANMAPVPLYCNDVFTPFSFSLNRVFFSGCTLEST